MDRETYKILACPLHRESRLIYEELKNCFICSNCKKKYEIIKFKGFEIPNFLIDEKNWKKGFRGLKSKFIKKVQGKLFERGQEEGKSILDVGCGEKSRGNINIDCYIPKVVPTNFILANAEYLPFRKSSIDIILSYYNIEHLINPADFIKNVYNIAKVKIEIVTDNSEWVGDVFFRLLGEGRIFNDEHYYKWSIEYMQNLLNRLGYKKNKVKVLNLSSSIIVRLISYLGKIPRIGNFFYRDLKVEIWKN